MNVAIVVVAIVAGVIVALTAVSSQVKVNKIEGRVELLEDEVSTLQGGKAEGDVGVTSYGRRRGVIKGVPE